MLKLSLSFDSYSSDIDTIFQAFAQTYKKEIKKYCKINKNTEHQLDNFGPGSAWLDESPYSLTLKFTDTIELTIK